MFIRGKHPCIIVDPFVGCYFQSLHSPVMMLKMDEARGLRLTFTHLTRNEVEIVSL